MEQWIQIGLALVLCIACFLAVAIPTGRLMENHTNEAAVKWLWYSVLGGFAFFTFIGMSGVGEFFENAGRQQIESHGTTGTSVPATPAAAVAQPAPTPDAAASEAPSQLKSGAAK